MDEADKETNDDNDRREWVNVSSGTGSPRLSQTKSRERKMVVCVCDCISSFSKMTEQWLIVV